MAEDFRFGRLCPGCRRLVAGDNCSWCDAAQERAQKAVMDTEPGEEKETEPTPAPVVTEAKFADMIAEIADLQERIGVALAVLPKQKTPHPDDSLQRLVNLAVGLLEGEDIPDCVAVPRETYERDKELADKMSAALIACAQATWKEGATLESMAREVRRATGAFASPEVSYYFLVPREVVELLPDYMDMAIGELKENAHYPGWTYEDGPVMAAEDAEKIKQAEVVRNTLAAILERG